MPGGPWDAQAAVLKSLTEARSQLGAARALWPAYLEGSRQRPEITAQAEASNAELETLQRTVAKPMPYRFTLQRLP
jgi:hypothetical protein